MYAIGCSTGAELERGALSGCIYLFNDRAKLESEQGGANESWGWKLNWPYDVVAQDPVGRFKTTLPYGITTVNRLSSAVPYGGRLYIVGWGTYNMVLDEHHRLWKQGIRGPEVPPTITGAVGTGAIGYISWYDEMTNERSPLSEGTVISTATPRTWTLPARPPDDIFVSSGVVNNSAPVTPVNASSHTHYLRPGDRVGFPDLHADISYNLVNTIGKSGKFTVDSTGLIPGTSKVKALPFCRATHCELWLSVAGGLPRLVMRVPIGTTTVVESTATGDLGESFFGAFERFPRCGMNTIWNDRQLMAGDPDNPDTVYMSELFLPERWAGLSFRTRDGASVTGLLALRDFCLVFSRDRTYMLQGYTENDFSFQMIEQSLGSIGHLCNAVIHGSAYVWTEKGPFMYNGSWHPLSPDNIFLPPSPVRLSDSSPETAGRSRAVVDPDANTYSLVSADICVVDRYLGTANGVTLTFDYTTVQPEAGGTFAPARLSVDTQTIAMNHDGNEGFPWEDFQFHYLTNKWGAGKVYSFSYAESLDTAYHYATPQSFYVVPYVRVNDLPQTTPGDSETYLTSFMNNEEFKIVLGHYYFGEIGGSVMEGKTFKRLWIDVRNYDATAALYVYPGDDDALELGGNPLSGGGGSTTFVYTLPTHGFWGGAASVSPIIKVTGDPLTGRGLSLVFLVPTLVVGASFRGFGGAFIEGPASRYFSAGGPPT